MSEDSPIQNDEQSRSKDKKSRAVSRKPASKNEEPEDAVIRPVQISRKIELKMPTSPLTIHPAYTLDLGNTIKDVLNNIGSTSFTLPGFDSGLLAQRSQLVSEVAALRQKSEDLRMALSSEKATSNEQATKLIELQSTLEELEAKDKLGFVLNRVNNDAQLRLLNSPEFRDQFFETVERDAVVMAVDIRRSTDLMLKARSPEDFAHFITELCARLMSILVDRYAVFDKFTGDGVLAFFPEFYSGPDAIYYAVDAADKCHEAFASLYEESRKLFTSILKDVGLGIGIDYGPVHLVQVAGGLTVVGGPVVYACRLSGGPSGMTLVNQPAYEAVSEHCGGSCFTAERELEVKHEGNLLAYEVRLAGRSYRPEPPGWLETPPVDGRGRLEQLDATDTAGDD